MNPADRTATLVSAALRHVRDAELLADPAAAHHSPDQAFHLAGFGPECVRKAILSVGMFDRAIGHDFAGVGERALEVALAIDPIASRYRPLDWRVRFPFLTAWKPEVRYERTGTRTPIEASRLAAEARIAVQETVAALWADGRVDLEAVR